MRQCRDLAERRQIAERAILQIQVRQLGGAGQRLQIEAVHGPAQH